MGCNTSTMSSEWNSEEDASQIDENSSPPSITSVIKTLILLIEGQFKESKNNGLTLDFLETAILLCYHFQTILQYQPRKRKYIEETLTQHFKKHKTVEIFCKLCAEILESGNSSEYTGIPTQLIEHVSYLLQFLMHCSDCNFELSSIISQQNNFLHTVTKKLQQWKIPHLKDIEMESEEESGILGSLCGVLHNITMFEDNVPKVRAVNCIEAVKPYLESKDNTIRLLCLATLADLVNESESEMIKSNDEIIEFLMRTISMAIDTDNRASWSLMELSRIVRQVARNDNNKRTVVQHGAVPLLMRINKSGNIEEQREAVRAIWTLSFDKQNKTEMIEKKEWNVIETLEKMSQSSDETVKKISKQALWTMKDQQNTSQTLEKSEDKEGDSRHIMISYNWGHQTMIKDIRDFLKKSGIKVWMDVDDMQGSTIEAMAKAVEQADIILLCYSFKYKNSDNCRAEAEYAFQLKKKIVPLKLEMNYKPDGWLGFIIGTKLFYDFSGKYPFEKKVNELVRELQEVVASSSNELVEVPKQVDILTNDHQPIVKSELPVTSGEKPKEDRSDVINIVKKWTPEQVEKWLDNNNLPKNLFVGLRGKDVAFFRLLADKSHDTFYQSIREQLNITDIKSMADFLFALDDLDSSSSL
ncbi:unnamed protein product [Mytilus coruscus]|uniref:TIR domain-containing protein n=1 Tax=Mytilus coruscus TaxID=42192 RepID=A0A6J8BJI7_MYTCO|nr:unnamed protein product [Mytilus coruscus]